MEMLPIIIAAAALAVALCTVLIAVVVHKVKAKAKTENTAVPVAEREKPSSSAAKRAEKPNVPAPPKADATTEKPADKPPAVAAQNIQPQNVRVENAQAEGDAAQDVQASAGENTAQAQPSADCSAPRKINIAYKRSYLAKLIQSEQTTKEYYSTLKNCLMSYGLKSRMSWKWESFRLGRKTVAKFRLRGKTLAVAFALDPDGYEDTKYAVENVGELSSYADTPCLYKIKNARRVKYAKELIAELMVSVGATAVETEYIDHVTLYPYESTEQLIKRKLIKEVKTKQSEKEQAPPASVLPTAPRKSVQAADVDRILNDEAAAALVEQSERLSDKTKTGIINIDTLSQFFKDGETVTIDEIKKRINGYRKTTYIKVLARGTLDKRLTVEADMFSPQAVKMIVLTGGKAIKKR